MDEKRESGYWLIVLLVIGLTALYANRHDLYAQYHKHLEGQAAVSEAQTQCAALEAQIDEARRLVKHLNSDPLEIEDAIRRNKNLVREGETIYRIQPAPESPIN